MAQRPHSLHHSTSLFSQKRCWKEHNKMRAIKPRERQGKKGEDLDLGEGTNTSGETRNLLFFFLESCLQSLKPTDDKTLFILPRGFPLLDVLPFKCNQMYSSPKIFCILCFLAQPLVTVRYEDHHLCFSSTTPDRLWYDGAQSSVSHDPSW